MLMGYFNAHWDGVGATYSDLAAWTADSCLKNEIEDVCTTNMISLDTFIRGETPSQIDHILTSSDDMLELMGFGCGTGGIWHIHKDHVPLWAEFKIVGGGLRPLNWPQGETAQET